MDDLARLLRTAGIDPEAAPSLLGIAAQHLREGTEMPADLAAYLAKAFARIEAAPQSERIDTLARSLGLDGEPGRPKKRLPVGDMALVVAVYGDREAELGLRSLVAKEFGISKSTAKARIQETKDSLNAAGERWQRILAESGHKKFVRPRETR